MPFLTRSRRLLLDDTDTDSEDDEDFRASDNNRNDTDSLSGEIFTVSLFDSYVSRLKIFQTRQNPLTLNPQTPAQTPRIRIKVPISVESSKNVLSPLSEFTISQ